jgi:hypothetical protein
MERRDSAQPAKSRRNKPCDLCRQKKLLCDLSGGPPCLRCQNSAQPCVFVQRQAERARQKWSQYRPPMPSTDDIIVDDHRLMPSCDGSDRDSFRTNEVRGSVFDIDANSEQLTNPYDQDPTTYFTNNHGSVGSQGSSPSVEHGVQIDNRHDHPSNSQTTAAIFRSASKNETTKRTTLENIPGAFSFYIGPTGVSDVHLLLRQLDGLGDVSLDIATGLNVRTVDQVPGRLQQPASAPVVFGVTDKTLVQTAEPRAPKSDLERIEAEFWSLLSRKSTYHLVRLYTRFVEPCFSILAPDQIPTAIDEIDNLSLALLAGICASSLVAPYMWMHCTLYYLLRKKASDSTESAGLCTVNNCILQVWRHCKLVSFFNTICQPILCSQTPPSNGHRWPRPLPLHKRSDSTAILKAGCKCLSERSSSEESYGGRCGRWKNGVHWRVECQVIFTLISLTFEA